MDYKQVDALVGVLARIADALESIDDTLTDVEDTLSKMG